MQQRVFLDRKDLPRFILDNGMGEKSLSCENYNFKMKIDKVRKYIILHCCSITDVEMKNDYWMDYDGIGYLKKVINNKSYKKLILIYDLIINSKDINFIIQVIEFLKPIKFNSIDEIILQLNNLIRKSGIYQEERNDE